MGSRSIRASRLWEPCLLLADMFSGVAMQLCAVAGSHCRLQSRVSLLLWFACESASFQCLLGGKSTLRGGMNRSPPRATVESSGVSVR
jgi:hypothetical protein